jgi:hypothetical protein
MMIAAPLLRQSEEVRFRGVKGTGIQRQDAAGISRRWKDPLFLDQNTMNRNRLLPLAFLLAAAGIVVFIIIRTRTPDVARRESDKPLPANQTPVVDGAGL